MNARATFSRGQNVVVYVPMAAKRQLASASRPTGKQASKQTSTRSKVKVAANARTGAVKAGSKANTRSSRVRMASAR